MKQFFTLGLLLFLSHWAMAQTSADTTKLKDVVLEEATILSSYRATSEMPVPFKDISLQEVEEKNFGQEPSFILGSTPAVTYYSDAGSFMGYAYFRLRGIDQTRINMTLDGVPLNEPEDQGAYFSNYPDFFNSVQSIQIQRGVGTSSNGVASYAGSINFESPSLHTPAKKEVYLGYGSYNTRRIYGELNTGVQNKTGLYVRASHVHSDGYKDRSGHTGHSLFLSTGHFGKKHLWKLSGFLGNQKNEMAWLGTPKDILESNPKYNPHARSDEEDQFLQGLLKLQHSVRLGAHSTLTSSTYYNYLKGDYDFDLNVYLDLPGKDQVYNYAFRSHFVGLFSNYALEKENFSFHAGVHGNLYQRQHNGSERTEGALYENTGFKNEFSAFAKASYQLNNFQFFGDLQYRYTEFDYQGEHDELLKTFTWDFVNPRVGLSYQLGKNVLFYYSLGQTHREPTRNDLFQGNDYLAIDGEQPLLGVTEAESVMDSELGIRMTGNTWQVNINGYYMDFDNEIVLSGAFGPNGLPLHNNVAKSFRSGLEIDYKFRLHKNISTNGNINFAYHRIKEEGVKIHPVLSPAFLYNQSLTYQLHGLRLGLHGRYQSHSYLDFANEYELDHYFLLDVTMAYEWKALTWTTRLNNLTNRQYYTNGQYDAFNNRATYHLQAPLNYFVSMKVTF
ncbi:TonB-dependent receptor [Rapidithrix thailandica]|uniref:TonB-dependent receptor n=1 Tax=Rapidithrix thailandica TaxID=413964 RepID=A0AAW9RZG4_9BACT